MHYDEQGCSSVAGAGSAGAANRHRYYDPSTASFLTQDPIKLKGGINNYRYVPNPISWVDPLGLSCKEGNGLGNSLSPEVDDPLSSYDNPTASLTDMYGEGTQVARNTRRMPAGGTSPIVRGNVQYNVRRIQKIDPNYRYHTVTGQGQPTYTQRDVNHLQRVYEDKLRYGDYTANGGVLPEFDWKSTGKPSSRELTGNNWTFNSDKDVDLRGTGKTYQDGLKEAFKRTGVPREQFVVTKYGKDRNGKSLPVEYSGPNGANVNMDVPAWNNIKASGSFGEGPHQPHIGYQTPGKGRNRVRGHIFVDSIPATRR